MVKSFCMKKISRYVIVFSKTEQLIPGEHYALIYRYDDIYVLAYFFCGQGFLRQHIPKKMH